MAYRKPWSQSGGGPVPADYGEAQTFYVHCGLTSVRRLLFMTYLCAVGEASQAQLNPLCGGWNHGNYETLQGMERAGFIRSARRPVPVRLHRGGASARSGRIYRAEDWGRRWLWRYGWVTRRVLIPDTCDAPLRDDVPSDPLEALKTCARPEFLRPAAMAIAHRLGRYGSYTKSQMQAATVMPGAPIYRYLRNWRRAGFVDKVELTGYATEAMPDLFRFRLTQAGRLALARHVDALRRAARASGHNPDPNEWRYPHHLEPEES